MGLGWSSENCIPVTKKQLSTAPELIHYSVDKETNVSADASAYGLGGVFLQEQGNDLYFIPPDTLQKLSRATLRLKKKL